MLRLCLREASAEQSIIVVFQFGSYKILQTKKAASFETALYNFIFYDYSNFKSKPKPRNS